MENLKDVKPIEDFNWDAYEKGDSTTAESKEAQEKAYDNTLNNVSDREVVDGTVIAMRHSRSVHRKPRRQKRPTDFVSQESTRYSFLGPRKRCA